MSHLGVQTPERGSGAVDQRHVTFASDTPASPSALEDLSRLDYAPHISVNAIFRAGGSNPPSAKFIRETSHLTPARGTYSLTRDCCGVGGTDMPTDSHLPPFESDIGRHLASQPKPSGAAARQSLLGLLTDTERDRVLAIKAKLPRYQPELHALVQQSPVASAAVAATTAAAVSPHVRSGLTSTLNLSPHATRYIRRVQAAESAAAARDPYAKDFIARNKDTVLTAAQTPTALGRARAARPPCDCNCDVHCGCNASGRCDDCACGCDHKPEFRTLIDPNTPYTSRALGGPIAFPSTEAARGRAPEDEVAHAAAHAVVSGADVPSGRTGVSVTPAAASGAKAPHLTHSKVLPRPPGLATVSASDAAAAAAAAAGTGGVATQAGHCYYEHRSTTPLGTGAQGSPPVQASAEHSRLYVHSPAHRFPVAYVQDDHGDGHGDDHGDDRGDATPVTQTSRPHSSPLSSPTDAHVPATASSVGFLLASAARAASTAAADAVSAAPALPPHYYSPAHPPTHSSSSVCGSGRGCGGGSGGGGRGGGRYPTADGGTAPCVPTRGDCYCSCSRGCGEYHRAAARADAAAVAAATLHPRAPGVGLRRGDRTGVVRVAVDTYSNLDAAPGDGDSVPFVVNRAVLVAEREAALLAWKRRRWEALLTERGAVTDERKAEVEWSFSTKATPLTPGGLTSAPAGGHAAGLVAASALTNNIVKRPVAHALAAQERRRAQAHLRGRVRGELEALEAQLDSARRALQRRGAEAGAAGAEAQALRNRLAQMEDDRRVLARALAQFAPAPAASVADAGSANASVGTGADAADSDEAIAALLAIARGPEPARTADTAATVSAPATGPATGGAEGLGATFLSAAAEQLPTTRSAPTAAGARAGGASPHEEHDAEIEHLTAQLML